MEKTKKYCYFIALIILSMALNVSESARGGGRSRGKNRGSRGNSPLKIFIPRNTDGASYYENSNVRILSTIGVKNKSLYALKKKGKKHNQFKI